MTFSILVLLHEGGHFLAARAFGVKVHEFMLGLPGPAVRVKIGDTSYGATAIPLGGYVRIAGMEPGEEDPLLGDALAVITRDGETDATRLAAEIGVDHKRATDLLYTLADWYAIESVVPDQQAKHTDEAQAADEVFRSLHAPETAAQPSKLIDAARSVTYRGLSTWKRVLVLSAGVAVNLISAVLVFTIVLAGWGYYEQSLTIEKTVPGAAAAAAGLAAGDTITAIGGAQIKDWQGLIDTIAKMQPGQKTTVTYTHSGTSKTVEVTLAKNPSTGKAFLGIQPSVNKVRPGVIKALEQSFVWLGMVFVAIGQFFNPQTFQTAVQGARSVVGISVEVSQAAQAGALSYAFMVALLSLSLGAMNILPIPPLDGGKIAMEIVEKIIGHPVSRKISIAISATGTLLLFSLIGYLMYADVVRYIVKG